MSERIHEDIVEAYNLIYGLAGKAQLTKEKKFWFKISRKLKTLDPKICCICKQQYDRGFNIHDKHYCYKHGSEWLENDFQELLRQRYPNPVVPYGEENE